MGHLGALVYCYATAPAPENATAAGGERAALRRMFRSWAPPVPGLVATFEEGSLIRTDIDVLVDVEHWVSGRVVVVGDAAHAMTPDLGQGACQALEDGLFLAASLAGTRDVRAGLRQFEISRRARPEGVARQARRLNRLIQSTGPIAELARRLTRLTPTRAMTRRDLELATSTCRPFRSRGRVRVGDSRR